MHFQMTVALAAAITGAAAMPMANPPTSSSSCSTGSNYCLQDGKLTEDQYQSCDSGSSYCCSSGDGLNLLSCTSLLNDLTISVSKRSITRRTESSSSSASCSTGSNVCKQNGKFTLDQYQECSSGDSYCCSSGDGLNVLTCTSALNGLTVDVPLSDILGGLGLGRRTNTPSSSSSSYCSSGSNACEQNGKFTSGQEQFCATGSAYCCASGSGVNALSCTNALNGATVDVGLDDILGGLGGLGDILGGLDLGGLL